jgi:hypothetical protein
MVWSLEGNPLNHKELEIYKYIKRQAGNSEFAHTVSRFIDLREYLDNNKFKSATDLRNSVLSDGVPIFSKSEAEQVFKLTAQTGGGGAGVDVLDNMVNQWVHYMYEWQPGFIKTGADIISPYVFIGKTLESGSFGPIFGIALDSITAILPSIAAAIENLTPGIIGFLPIPEAGPIGAIIGWMLASVFVILAMLINVSRAHFGKAFIVSFLLIPFLGSTLYNGALSAERLGTKIATRREQLINSVGQHFGKVPATVLEAIVPDPLQIPEDSPKKPVNLLEMGEKTISGLKASVGMPKGGKRLSRRNHSKGKWLTRRRSKL